MPELHNLMSISQLANQSMNMAQQLNNQQQQMQMQGAGSQGY